MILSLRDKALALQDCARLTARGVTAMACPVHVAQAHPYDETQLAKADGFILTSQQAAQALPLTDTSRPVFTVGRASAASAKARGYDRVFFGPSDGAALAKMMHEMMTSDERFQAKKLCWLRAPKISFDIRSALIEKGHQIEQQTVYQMVPASQVPDEVISAFDKGAVSGIMGLSKSQLSQAQILFDHHHLAARSCDLFAVSEAVAEFARQNGWSSVFTSRRKRAISVQACVIARDRQRLSVT